jgi:hypothetical protein
MHRTLRVILVLSSIVGCDSTASRVDRGSTDSRGDIAGADNHVSDGVAPDRIGSEAGPPPGVIIPADRRVDWHPGVPGGIPTYSTICANAKSAPYSAKGDGVTDDSKAIQAAIDACPAGQAVLLPQGTYRVVTGLSIQKGIVLRGEGPAKTRVEGDKTAEKAIIQIGSWDESNAPVTSVSSGLAKGAKTLVVADTSPFAVGDLIIVDQQNDNDLVQVTGSETPCTWGSRENGGRLLGQIVEVTSVSVAQKTLGIDPPLAMTLSSALKPEVERVRKSPPRRAGIEDLTVADRSYRGDNQANIRLWGTGYSWIRGVESVDVSGRHFQLTKCFRCEVRDSYVHHAHSYMPGANAYGIALDNQTSESLVENSIAYYLNVGIVLGSSGPGNVIAYNYTDKMFGSAYPDCGWLMADLSSNHCAHPFMSLFEGNQVSQISSDNIHGSSSHQTFFRNAVDRRHEGCTHTGNLGSVVLAASNRYMNLVGNVLGRTGDKSLAGAVYEQIKGNCLDTVSVYKLGYPSDCGVSTITDPKVKATLLRHGNHDYVNDAVVWDSAISEHKLPASLYLTAKPAYFGAVPWPPIGPDVQGLVKEIPARLRFKP